MNAGAARSARNNSLVPDEALKAQLEQALEEHLNDELESLEARLAGGHTAAN